MSELKGIYGARPQIFDEAQDLDPEMFRAMNKLWKKNKHIEFMRKLLTFLAFTIMIVIAFVTIAFAQTPIATLPNSVIGWISYVINIAAFVGSPWVIKNRALLKKAVPILKFLIDTIEGEVGNSEPATKGLTGSRSHKTINPNVLKAIADGRDIIKKAA